MELCQAENFMVQKNAAVRRFATREKERHYYINQFPRNSAAHVSLSPFLDANRPTTKCRVRACRKKRLNFSLSRHATMKGGVSLHLNRLMQR